MSTQKTKPLTDAQITELLKNVSVEGSYAANLVRAVEIYHGIINEEDDHEPRKNLRTRRQD